MRKLLLSAALLVSGLTVLAPAAGATETGTQSFGPPPKCIPQSQTQFVGLEIETWKYLRTEGNTHYYDYSFNNFHYGEVSCTA